MLERNEEVTVKTVFTVKTGVRVAIITDGVSMDTFKPMGRGSKTRDRNIALLLQISLTTSKTPMIIIF